MTELGETIYTPIDETSFKLEETRHLETTVNVPDQLNNIAGVVSQMKNLVAQVQTATGKFVSCVKWYREWQKIIATWIEKGWIPMEAPKELDITDEELKTLDLMKFDVERLPKIEVNRVEK